MNSIDSITNNDISIELQNSVKVAISDKSPLYIHGGNSKLFFGNIVDAKPLDISPHTGIIDYEPTELCITVRAGTLLSDIEKVLTAENQILPFEPPQYSPNATIGGALATGISGPRRAYTGSVRDAILGVKIINGEGEIVSFGGQVMKNVAGYDLSRMMVRSQGTLGVILEVSIRLLPKPKDEITISLEGSQSFAINFFQSLRTQQLPVTASAWFNDQAFLRLSGSEKSLAFQLKEMISNNKASPVENPSQFWNDIRDHKHHFFGRMDKPLWRLSLPPAADEIKQINDNQLIEWGGAQRWVNTNTPPNIVHSSANSRNGYATLFQGNIPETSCFPKLDDNLLKLHRQLKNNMDPNHIFNPGRMYSGL
ncbi:MAG: glycolate oxidase FAD binding subunit [Cocleimonas sp.]|jgi:glycolate oxidase FAD binding subunit